MNWLLIKFLFIIHHAAAAGTQNATSEKTAAVETEVGWYSGPNDRSTLSLVYSCLITIFACTWTVLHLNVPKPTQVSWYRKTRKVRWMVVTILFPEFIFSKAVCDLQLALKSLHGFDKKLQERYIDGLTCKRVTRVGNDFDVQVHYRWRVKYDSVVLLLFKLFGLPQPKMHNFETDEPRETDELEEMESKYPKNLRWMVRKELMDAARRDTLDATSSDSDSPRRKSWYLPSEEARKKEIILEEWQDWTLTHSFLANMGGLMYRGEYDPKSGDYFLKDRGFLTGTKLINRSWGDGGHPLEQLVLSQDDIRDKSKADWLLRGLAVMQISWLVLTVMARRASALPLTQLELATLAFSIFAIATYAVNWWKPKDISQPIFLQAGKFKMRDRVEPPQAFFLRLAFPGIVNFLGKGFTGRDLVGNDYVELQGRLPLIFRLMAVTAFIFGAIHCLAWNFEFPSRAETILWRIASIGSTLVPVISLALSILANQVMITAEKNHVSFVLGSLDRLGAYPPRYMNLLQRPVFRSHGRDYALLYLKPEGMRDFEHVPTDAEIEELKRNRRDFRYRKFQRKTNAVLTEFNNLMYCWENIKTGKKGSLGIIDVFWDCLRDMREYYTKDVEDFLVDYEKSYVETLAPPIQGTPPGNTVFQYIFKDMAQPFQDQCEAREKLNDTWEYVGTFSTMIGLILYIIVRLIIIVLLFTSLRKVPRGVYEETSWTRFLPSFS